MIEELKKVAELFGECGMLSAVQSYEELCKLLFSPQGREFCEKHNFPFLYQFQRIKKESDVDKYGVFIDFGEITGSNNKDIALIGKTQAKLTFNDNKAIRKIILMHGAEAVIHAGGYEVLLIVKIGDCKVEIHKDETVTVLR